MIPPALSRVVDDLRCPVCLDGLRPGEAALSCGNGHMFDVARQGYVTLLDGSGHPGTGDTADMVARRVRFLERGHYDVIGDAIADAAGDVDGLCVDVAGGTGHHLARLLDRRPGLAGLDVDLSTFAVRRAARLHDRLAAVRADAWRALPVRDDRAALALSVFGPRNADETARILRPGGRLVVVTPRPDHLRELVAPLRMLRVDPRKRERLDERLRGFAVVGRETVEHTASFTRADAADDVLMGPSAHHLDPTAVTAAIDGLPEPLSVTVAVDVAVYTV